MLHQVGGSTVAFERVTAAHDTLSDAKRRAAYDNGEDLPRDLQRDGSQGPDMRERVCSVSCLAGAALRSHSHNRLLRVPGFA